jgi:phage regulator Rha-like protein
VKRNINRFPEDFMFQLTAEEWADWSQTVMSSGKNTKTIDNQSINNSSQIVMSSEGGKSNRGKAYRPYAFTEHGVTMLASVLRSEKAVNMSIAVVRAFIALKEYAIRQHSLTDQLQEIRDRLGEHDVQLNSIYTAIENLLDEKADQKNWQDRPRIGFKP